MTVTTDQRSCSPSPSPSPSLSDSSASDSGSEFELITPSKSTLGKRTAPSASPSPAISSDEQDRTSENELIGVPSDGDDEQGGKGLDEYGAPRRGKQSTRGGVKKHRGGSIASSVSTSARGGVKGAGYTMEEDLALFYELRPKISPSWANVARRVGRDAKSCQNRWGVLEKKVVNAILGQGSITRRSAKGSYTAGEDLTLFNEVRPKISPSWGSVADRVGRDAKNRWTVLNKRIESFILGRGF